MISDYEYRKNLRAYIREIQQELRKKEIANRPPGWKPPKPVLKRVSMKFKPLGWVFPTEEELKRRRAMKINPLKKHMTPLEKAIYNRIPYKRRLEEKTHAWAKKLRRIRNFKFPQFKAKILKEDERRIRREKIIRRLFAKRYSPAMTKYLNTLPEHHRARYAFYRLREVFPYLKVPTRHNKADWRLLFALFRHQAYFKHFMARLRVILQWKRVCRFRRQMARGRRWIRPPFPFPGFRPSVGKRLLRKVRFYYAYLPRTVLQARSTINYRIKMSLLSGLIARRLRRVVVRSPTGWFKTHFPTYRDRAYFISRLKAYKNYMEYLIFLNTWRGKRFKPEELEFDIVERIRYYNLLGRMRMNVWGVDHHPNLRYNLRSRFENFYRRSYRRRWKRMRWFMKRKTRRVSTYNFKYYRARKHFRRTGRIFIRNVTLPIVDVRRTVNNFFIHVQQNNRTLFLRTAGMAGKVGDKPGFTGPKRRTPYAAEITGREIGQRLLSRGLEDILVRYRSRYSYFVKAAIKGLRSAYVRKKNTKEGRLKNIKTAFYRQKLRIPEVRIWVTLSHNGLRPKKARRM